jgi:hypothetical protein
MAICVASLKFDQEIQDWQIRFAGTFPSRFGVRPVPPNPANHPSGSLPPGIQELKSARSGGRRIQLVSGRGNEKHSRTV